MRYKKCAFSEALSSEILEFLKESRRYSAQNWFLDRWNFCRYCVQASQGSFENWPETVGLWREPSGRIAAMAISEGAANGEAFFQFGEVAWSDPLIHAMLDHAETQLSAKTGTGRALSLWVSGACDPRLPVLLAQRGYAPTGKTERSSVMELDAALPVAVPAGFRIVDATGFTDAEWALAHARAFGNCEAPDAANVERRARGYGAMRKAPDFRPEFNLALQDVAGDIASFATIWVDDRNALGVFEPVGTIPRYRLQGLGRALLYHGMNRLRATGARLAYVGSVQRFYLSIGFRLDTVVDECWHWHSPSAGG